MQFPTLACSVAICAALVGCESDEDMTRLVPIQPSPELATAEAVPDAAADTDAVTPSASPEQTGQAWKRQRVDEAMEGLVYDTGLVTVDESYAASIPHRGDASVSQSLQQQGHTLFFDENRHLEALRSLSDAIIVDPTNVAAYADLGSVLVGRGELDKAQASYQSALAIDETNLDALTGMALVHQMNGDLNASNETWMRVLELDPQHGLAHARLAVGRYFEGEYASAWTHYYAAVDFGGEVPAQLPGMLSQHVADPRP